MSQILRGLSLNLGFDPQPHALVKTNQGKYLISGRAFNGSNPDSGFAVLYNPFSSIPVEWQQSYTGQFSTMFEDAAQLRDGNFIAVGIWFTSIYAGDENIWMVKINAADGSIIWQKNIGKPGIKSDGYSVAASDDGGFVLTALSLDYSQNVLKSQVMSFDTNGNQLWETDVNKGVAYSIIKTRNGGYALCGASQPDSSFNTHLFAVRMDSSGKLLWQRVFSDLTIYAMLQSDIIENSDGSLVMCGKSGLIKADANGETIWQRQNYSLDLSSVIALPSGSYALAGSMIDSGISVTRAYVASVDEMGSNLDWDNSELSYNSTIAQLALTDNNLVMATGTLPSGKSSDLFICTFTNSKILFP